MAAAAAESEPDRVALVTGCSGAIGRQTALAFAALNYRLVLVDANEQVLQEVGRLCLERSPRSHQVSQWSLSTGCWQLPAEASWA